MKIYLIISMPMVLITSGFGHSMIRRKKSGGILVQTIFLFHSYGFKKTRRILYQFSDEQGQVHITLMHCRNWSANHALRVKKFILHHKYNI